MQEVLYEANPSLLRTRPFGTVLLIVLLLVGVVLAIASRAISGSLGLPAQVIGPEPVPGAHGLYDPVQVLGKGVGRHDL